MNETITAITEQTESLQGVDSCLSDLYSRAIEQQDAVPTVKSVLLNLVIYVADPKLADSAEEQASQVLSAVACRAIVADLASPERSEGASVSVICGISERGDKRLCGEVIRLYAPPGSVTGAVMPLLLPDVPVYLWVMGEIPTQSEDFTDLLRVASHVIVDTRLAEGVGQSLRAVERLRKGNGGRRIVQDLAWVSLHSWREATAQHFDPPAIRHYLTQVTDVNVDYSGSSKTPLPDSAPLLFASWFMDRVGLAVKGAFHSRDEGFRIDAVRDESSAIVRVVPKDSDRNVGQLFSAEIRCGSGDTEAQFVTQRMSDTELSLTQECREVCLPPKEIEEPVYDDAALVTKALNIYRRDHSYEQALHVALRIIDNVELADERSVYFRL